MDTIPVFHSLRRRILMHIALDIRRELLQRDLLRRRVCQSPQAGNQLKQFHGMFLSCIPDVISRYL